MAAGKQFDSYGPQYFKVEILNASWQYLGLFAEISGIGAEIDVYTHEEGGSNDFIWKLPKHVKYPNIVLKRGITDDQAMEQWISRFMTDGKRVALHVSAGGRPNQAPLLRWKFMDCFPVKWTGPTFTVLQNQVAQETIEIAHHGPTPRV